MKWLTEYKPAWVLGLAGPTSYNICSYTYHFLFYYYYYYYYYYHVFVVKLQESAWSASYGEYKTVKTIQGPASPGDGTNKYPLPVGKQAKMKTETVLPKLLGMGPTSHPPPA